MTRTSPVTAFSRQIDSPTLPAPAHTMSVMGRLRQSYFSSVGSGVVTVLLSAIMIWLVWTILDFALFRAVWSGTTREACLSTDGGRIGACWPFVHDKIGQWIYGFFPIDQRWRINLMFAAFAAGLVPALMPTIGGKRWSALYLIVVFPVFAYILMTGGHVDIAPKAFSTCATIWALSLTLVPMLVSGAFKGWDQNRIGVSLCFAGSALALISYFTNKGPKAFGIPLDVTAAFLAGGIWSVGVCLRDEYIRSARVFWACLGLGTIIVLTLLALAVDFGLQPVTTSQWGGLTLTLIVAVTGIFFSLPLGIAMALGRQSTMPAVRIISVTLVEVTRGVPLITVLFMASVMLPLFLPPGTNFDKLLRALVGVTLFSSALMAEVVRGGLAAVPKGQIEGANALGLGYWQTMSRIILPQALKVSIPNIVSNFIVLFKDTTLVLIIGLFDLLALSQTSLRDATWATPVTAPTGYLVIALIYWAFCFSMSRYARFTEARLNTGHKK